MTSQPYALTAATAENDFRFCVTQFQISSGAGGEAKEARLGLINLSDAENEVTWGEVPLETSTAVDKMVVELHRDPESCEAAAYSLSYKGTQLTTDLAFEFNFSPSVTVRPGSAVTFAMSGIVEALDAAYNQGKLNNSSIGEFMEQLAGAGSLKK